MEPADGSCECVHDHDEILISPFENLPTEILERIFCMKSVTAKDVVNLSLTCQRFHSVVANSNQLWRQKFRQRWGETYCHLPWPKIDPYNWRDLFVQRFLTKKSTATKLEQLASLTQSGDDIPLKARREGRFYDFLEDEHFLPHVSSELKPMFVLSALSEVIKKGDCRNNLTQRYHAENSLMYLRHLSLRPEIDRFIRQTLDKDIEEGAVLIAQWFQPCFEFSVNDIKSQFDQLAEKVRQVLYIDHPEHSVFAGSAPVIPEKLEASLWIPSECKQIVMAIGSVFNTLFNQNFQHYFEAENSFINLVLERRQGIPITLCLVVQSIARRLGVILEPVSFPCHFILRWLEYPRKIGIDQYTFIDPFNKEFSLTFQNVLNLASSRHLPINRNHCDACSKQEVLVRIVRNLVNIGKRSISSSNMMFFRHAAELHSLICPEAIDVLLLSMQLTIHLQLNLQAVRDDLQKLQPAHPDMLEGILDLEYRTVAQLRKFDAYKPERKQPKRRSKYPEVKFATGMVMKHLRYHYECVIYGWDNRCKAKASWILQMGVNNLPRGSQQPFYNVLVMDGSNRYAAEENLVPTRCTEPITHPEVGMYFESFNEYYYTANRMTEELYPDDTEVAKSFAVELLTN